MRKLLQALHGIGAHRCPIQFDHRDDTAPDVVNLIADGRPYRAERSDYDFIHIINILLFCIHLQDGESLENALRRFKRKVQKEDIVKEIKRDSFYLKPVEKQRTREALAREQNRTKRARAPE